MICLRVTGEEKTSMELLDEILSKENLNKAYLQVYRNKGASGIDGVKEAVKWQ